MTLTGVLKGSSSVGGGVATPGSVGLERRGAVSRVEAPTGVTSKCICTAGCVDRAGRVVQKRTTSSGRVAGPGRVGA